ncbi:hypothetical protein PybrP1_010554 [[Pythium] brassicae (nom. inval.)]|nr:hypothetical protein PybrP1_010554 [[Pythium] brassicae (nom. inval.)]
MATNCPYGLRALATVVFDIDAGQRLDALHPPDCGLSAAAQASLAHLALPHSTSQDEGDTQFAVRFHESTEPSSTFLYGFVLFRQQRDESRSRGYFQKALVLVSERPYVDLYDRVLRVAGPLFFSVGAQVLRAVYDGIHSWPAPTFGVPTVLPLAGTFVTCIIPQLIDYGDLDAAFDAEPLPSPPSSDHFIVESDEQSLSDDPASEEDEDDSSGGAAHAPSPSFGDLLISRRAHQVSAFESVGLYSSFVGLESSLWLLWQLAITGESLVVLSPHARTCSQATLAFTSLIAPLQFQGDYRPYYTLYESDFDELVRRQNRSVSRPSEMTVIGTTNPFFLKSLNRWPNALVFPFVEATQAKESSPATTSSDSENRECVSLRIKKKVDLDVFEPSARARILRRCSAFVVPDATVLRQLVCQQEVYLTQTASVLEDPHTAINNAILRKHFRKLTKRFLEPFEQYFGIWKANGVRPNLYMSAADFMKPFELQSFLASVNPRKLPRQIRASKWKALYTGFVQSPHFEPWFTYRRARCVRHFATTMRSVRAGISASMLLRSACGKELSREQCKQLQVEIESALAMERMREPVDEEQMRVIEGHLKAVRKRLKPKKARKSK